MQENRQVRGGVLREEREDKEKPVSLACGEGYRQGRLLRGRLPGRLLAVVVEAEVGDEGFAHDVAEGVFELHGLDEEVVFGVEAGGGVGGFEVEGEPFLYSYAAEGWGSGGQVEEEAEVEGEGGG